MDDNIKSLASARALKTGNNTQWSPEEALVQALEDLRAGRIKPRSVIIEFIEDGEDGVIDVSAYRANLDWKEEIAIRAIRLQDSIRKQV